MKYKGVFGVVALIHVGLGLFVITQPGCQTTQEDADVVTNPIIDPVDESELPDMSAEPVAPVAEGPEDDLFQPLDSSFNSGAPEPVYVDIPEDSNPPANSTRSEPLRPEAPISAEPIGILDYAPVAEEPVPVETMTVVSDSPVKETYSVVSGDSLWAISKKFGVSVSSIRAENALTSDSLQVGQVLMIPLNTREVSVTAPRVESISPAVSQDFEGNEYVVVSGDTLSGIAQKAGVSVAVIRSANNLKGDLIKAGDVLILPNGGSAQVSGTTAPISRIENRSEPVVSGVYHVVKSGENPTVIARKYGISVQELISKNGNFDPRALRVGQRLLVGDLEAEAEQPVEVDIGPPAPKPPVGFQPVAPNSGSEISVEIPEQPAPEEPEFDEEAFLKEIEEAPVVSPVPVQ